MKLAALVLPALLAAQPPAPAPRGVAAAPDVAASVNSFQTFTREGHRAFLLHASTMKGDRAQFDLTGMNLSVFAGDATNHIETILLSPKAVFQPEAGIARGQDSVRVIRDDLEATGTRWNYDNGRKRISLDGDVRIVFHAELKDLLK